MQKIGGGSARWSGKNPRVCISSPTEGEFFFQQTFITMYSVCLVILLLNIILYMQYLCNDLWHWGRNKNKNSGTKFTALTIPEATGLQLPCLAQYFDRKSKLHFLKKKKEKRRRKKGNMDKKEDINLATNTTSKFESEIKTRPFPPPHPQLKSQ